jgi:hypothetical protein
MASWHTGIIMSDNFRELHANQLRAINFPTRLLPRLHSKLLGEVFDAGGKGRELMILILLSMLHAMCVHMAASKIHGSMRRRVYPKESQGVSVVVIGQSSWRCARTRRRAGAPRAVGARRWRS